MTGQTDTLLLKTMTVFRSNLLRERVSAPNFNLIACGASRGGTSSAGVLMRYFGFESGGEVHPTTHEDLEFVNLVVAEQTTKMPDLIRRRNQIHPGWSLKLPWALIGCEIFDRYCTNPIFFVMIRNPMSVALTLSARDPRYADDILAGFGHAHHFYHNGIQALRRVTSPFVICEYEKTLATPRIYVEEFAELFNLSATSAQIDDATNLISEKGYKTLPIAGNG